MDKQKLIELICSVFVVAVVIANLFWSAPLWLLILAGIAAVVPVTCEVIRRKKQARLNRERELLEAERGEHNTF